MKLNEISSARSGRGEHNVAYRVARDVEQASEVVLIMPRSQNAYFQLTQAATTPNGSHRTSLTLYIIKKFVGRFSALNAFSPCVMVHFSFSVVTRISPNEASIRVLPESRHAAVAMTSWFSRMYLVRRSFRQIGWSQPLGDDELYHAYFSRVRSTFLLCLKLVLPHSTCASLALTMALLIPSAVAGFTRPRERPLAGQ